MLIQYVRNERCIPVACVVGTKIDGKIKIGVSVLKPGDKFNRQTAIKVALGNTVNPIVNPIWFDGVKRRIDGVSLSDKIESMIDEVEGRCKRYYGE